MATSKPPMKMPEFVVFAKTAVVGFIAAQILRLSYYLAESFAKTVSGVSTCATVAVIVAMIALCLAYALHRGALTAVVRMCRSWRLDLLAAVVIGAYVNELVTPCLSKLHAAVQAAGPGWAPAVLLLLSVTLLSALVRHYLAAPKGQAAPLYFLADDEVRDPDHDLLASTAQAKSFADTVLASGAHPGLVFGLEGPWGAGKTSFINLAQRHWEDAKDEVIVCRFEPLRYASESDLTERLIRDLSAAIRSQVFAPEFKPAATRYSRLIKGKADVSFLGFKLSLEPSEETVDELLDAIDQVLLRIGRRVVIVVDDLDRLDPKTTNNVLFATKRTFTLSQATYVLCYDTEVLASASDDASRAREFLEKFVTVKLSLFVDTSSLSKFLLLDWASAESQIASVPSDTMLKLGAVLTTLASLLDGDLAPHYLPMIGNLRKVKRFINTILLMQIEKTDLGRTDFDKRDLINLMLLHLNYPGVFRQIYAEETHKRRGRFSLTRDGTLREFVNHARFATYKEAQPEPAKFLLDQLFDRDTLEINDKAAEESIRRSRACFNSADNRNLEAFLNLIVRFVVPLPQQTFVLYQGAIDRVRRGEPLRRVLGEPDLALEQGDNVHDQFWRILVNQSYDFNADLTQDAIETLVENMPRYSSVDLEDRALRPRSVYSLLRLLDSAGWGRNAGAVSSRRRSNTRENVQEIAWRIFGEQQYAGQALIDQLASGERGVLGWNDLMIFRLQCSADRQSQLHEIHAALIVNQDMTAETAGLVSNMAIRGMRKLSQRVFSLFKRTYIDPRRNFLSAVELTEDKEFLGHALVLKETAHSITRQQDEEGKAALTRAIEEARFTVKSFVIYQLSNDHGPSGSGVGCGYYDEEGIGDAHGIARLMNEYVFGVCFDPDRNEENMQLFLDHCLSHLTSAFFTGREDGGLTPTRADLPGALAPAALTSYWREHRERYKAVDWQSKDRSVATPNYTATYSYLPAVFAVLDELVDAPAMEDQPPQADEPEAKSPPGGLEA